MIGWQNPSALWGLLLVAGPIAVHLLRRQRAARVLFPSLRFVQASQSAAVRLRPPTDLILMLVRAAVVALAVTATAGPIVVTAARMARWSENLARVVIVDASDSMRGAGIAAASSEAAFAERKSATYAERVDARDLVGALRPAASWLATTPPSRKEIVVISDFQRGAIEPAGVRKALADIDSAIGLRFVAVGAPVERVSFEGGSTLGTATTPGRSLAIELSRDATASVLTAQSTHGSGGLRLIVADEDRTAATRLLDAVARAGTPAGSTTEPIAIRFSGAVDDLTNVEPIRSTWMLDVVARLGRSAMLTPLVRDSGSAAAVSAALPWVAVLRRDDGRPVVGAARVHNELIVDVAASADTFFAAAVVRETLSARQSSARYAEQEIARVDPKVLSSLERSSGAVSDDAWRYADGTDARWCWLAAIALLAVEQRLRVERERAGREDSRAAA